jgi:hypothetical protein
MEHGKPSLAAWLISPCCIIICFTSSQSPSLSSLELLEAALLEARAPSEKPRGGHTAAGKLSVGGTPTAAPALNLTIATTGPWFQRQLASLLHLLDVVLIHEEFLA